MPPPRTLTSWPGSSGAIAISTCLVLVTPSEKTRRVRRAAPACISCISRGAVIGAASQLRARRRPVALACRRDARLGSLAALARRPARSAGALALADQPGQLGQPRLRIAQQRDVRPDVLARSRGCSSRAAPASRPGARTAARAPGRSAGTAARRPRAARRSPPAWPRIVFGVTKSTLPRFSGCVGRDVVLRGVALEDRRARAARRARSPRPGRRPALTLSPTISIGACAFASRSAACAQRRRGRAASASRDVRRRRDVDLGLGVQHVHRQRQEDRALRRLGGDLERAAQRARHVVGVLDLVRPLGDRLRHLDQRPGQVRLLEQHAARRLAGVDAPAASCRSARCASCPSALPRPGAMCSSTNDGPPGQARVGVGHADGDALVQRQHELRPAGSPAGCP